jgi:hypothetical protein
MIPDATFMKAHPEQVSKSWVTTYKDLCEWAVLYETICYEDFNNSTIIVKDGLLRSKIFRFDKGGGRALFIEMMKRINASIEKASKERKVKIYFVGLAKHSQVLSRYSLAMQLENTFPSGEPRFAQVPGSMEERSYVWKEYMRKGDNEEGEINKYSFSSLYLVRFGKASFDPVWAIDLMQSQTNADAEIFGYLLMDTINGFPIPHYPACLQKALEYAQVVDFDLDILQDEVVNAIRDILPSDKRTIMDHQILSREITTNRQP